MSTVRTKFHMPFGQHIYADAPRDFVVDQIITLYSDKGLNGFTNTRWSGDAFQPTAHIMNDVGYQLGRWCLDQNAHDLLKAFHSVFSPNAHKELIAHTLHSKDDTGFDFLMALRPNAAWIDALRLAFGPQSNQAWLSKILQRPVGDAVWQSGVEKLLEDCRWRNDSVLVEAVLGGWCTTCQSLLCSAPNHRVRPFLDQNTPGDMLGLALGCFVPPLWMQTQSNVLTVLNLIRRHPAWDNALKSVQTPLDKILKKAVEDNNAQLIALLLGPNDRVLTAEEHKQRLCVNPKHIASAFLTMKTPHKNPLAAHFIGLMDDNFFEAKREWAELLHANRERRQYVLLQKITQDSGEIRLKRKM